MRKAIIFHPRKGVFLTAMSPAQMDRWRRRNGFILFSWEYGRPKEDDLISLLQYLSVSLLWSADWARMIDSFAKINNSPWFRRLLRGVSQDIQLGKPFEQSLRMIFPAPLVTAILSSQKRGQLSTEIEHILDRYRHEAQERNKRKAKRLYPLTLGVGLLGLIVLVDVQFVPVLKSLFDSYGMSPPVILGLFDARLQLGALLVLVAVGGIIKMVYQKMSFVYKSHIPIIGNLLAIGLHQQLLDAYHESLIRECSYDHVLQERYEVEVNPFLRFGMSTVAGRLKQGLSLRAALNEIPAIGGWVGSWERFVNGAPPDLVLRGLDAYQRQIHLQEIRLKDNMQTVMVSILVIGVAMVVSSLGILITLPLQYADKLI